MPPPALQFDADVPAGGYAWWYLDAVADDGCHALAVIAFVGAAFSPAYYRAKRADHVADPAAHCALNVALYGPRANRWTLTEYPRSAISRATDTFALGRSTLAWSDTQLHIELAERTPWWGRPLRGRVVLRPDQVLSQPEPLDASGRHLWWCVAPNARVEVELDEPRLSFTGAGYLDANTGVEPLEAGIAAWNWSRGRTEDGSLVVYDTVDRSGVSIDRAFRFGRGGRREPVALPYRHELPRGRWGLSRTIRSDRDDDARLVASLEDGPFYARSLVRNAIGGREHLFVHESISLDSFRDPFVRAMLPFRIRPRWRT
jgi:carotenoid 1,2-hydratase